MSIIMTNTTFAMDGLHAFNVGPESYSWSNRWLNSVSISSLSTKFNLTATVTLSGADWAANAISFASTGKLKAIVIDSDTDTGRYIETLTLGASSTVRLLSTGFGSIAGSNGVDDIVTGSAYVRSIALGAGNNLLTVGSGGAGVVTAGSGNDTIVTGSGWVGSIQAGSGINAITTGSAYVTSITTLNGNDRITIGSGGAETIDAGSGVNTISADGYVGSIATGAGADQIDLHSGGAGLVAAGSGNNRISTGSGFVGTIVTLGGADNITTGSGGATLVDAGSGNNQISTDGYVAAIHTGSGADTITTGAGGAGEILAGDGANRITTGSGWVASVVTGTGADVVTVGAGGIGWLATGKGADTIVLSELQADKYVRIDAGADTSVDTLDVSGYTHGLTLSLNTPDTWQSLGSGGIYIANVDRIIGTGFDDVLTGSSTGSNINNILAGGAGKDSLDGGAGADRLIGGSGTDLLIGGLGKDVFEFAFATDSVTGNTRDTIADFSHAERDIIDLSRIDANANASGDQAFSWFADGNFHANGLWLKDGILYGDVDGKAGADFEIALTAVKSLLVADFLL